MDTVGLFSGIVVAMIAAGGSYLVALRRLSGKIATSEAAELWQESKAIREDYRERLASLEARVAQLEQQNNELVAANLKLRENKNKLESTVASLLARAKSLEEKNARLRAELKGGEHG